MKFPRATRLVILSTGHAEEALAWLRWAMTNIGLTLNETKTCIRDATHETFDFLGYTFGPDRYRKDGHWYLAAKPSNKSVQRVKQTVREIFRKGAIAPWDEVVARLNRTLVGWSNYFNYGTRLMAYRAVDNYVYERSRAFLRRRHKVQSRGTREFPAERVFGELGVIRLRARHVGPRP